MKNLISLSLVIFGLIVSAGVVCGQNGAAKTDTSTTRAQEVLRQAMTALGGEAKLRAVQSLSVNGKFRRIVQTQDQSGNVELQFLLPDKYKKTEVISPMAGVEVTVISALNGTDMWTDMQTFAGGAGVSVVRAGATPDAAAQAAKKQELRAEFARNLIAWLLRAPSDVEFNYVGEAEADSARADIISAKGQDGLTVQLFLDQKTHRPLMVTYMGRVAKVPTAMASTDNAQANQMKKQAEGAATSAPQEVEVRVYFSDYRTVDGILLPHQITKEVSGTLSEELEVKSYKINPTLTAQKFEKK